MVLVPLTYPYLYQTPPLKLPLDRQNEQRRDTERGREDEKHTDVTRLAVVPCPTSILRHVTCTTSPLLFGTGTSWVMVLVQQPSLEGTSVRMGEGENGIEVDMKAVEACSDGIDW